MRRALEGGAERPDDLITRLECDGWDGDRVSEVVCRAICSANVLSDLAAHSIVALGSPPNVSQTLRILRHFERVEEAGGQVSDAFVVALSEILGRRLDDENLAPVVTSLAASAHERIRVAVALAAESAWVAAPRVALEIALRLRADTSPDVMRVVEHLRERLGGA